MNGRTSKLLRKYARVNSRTPSSYYTRLKRWWKRDLNRDERTEWRKKIRSELEEEEDVVCHV